MPSVQLTKGNTQVASVTATFNAGTPAGINVPATIVNPRGIALAGASQQSVPTAEYWYITGIYLSAGTSVSIANALLVTYVNNVPQPFAPAEDEVQQTTYNKLVLPPQEWIQLPNGQAWQQALQPQATVTTTTTTVTFFETILRMPLAALS